MRLDREEAKKHMEGKSTWHHMKGKAIEVGLYALSHRVKLNKPAPKGLSVWTLQGEEVSLDEIVQSYNDEGKMVILNIGSFTGSSDFRWVEGRE